MTLRQAQDEVRHPERGRHPRLRHDGRAVGRASTRSRPTCGSTSTSTPRSSADNSNYIGYMGPNAAAQQLIDPAILSDPDINPSKDDARPARRARAARGRRPRQVHQPVDDAHVVAAAPGAARASVAVRPPFRARLSAPIFLLPGVGLARAVLPRAAGDHPGRQPGHARRDRPHRARPPEPRQLLPGDAPRVPARRS